MGGVRKVVLVAAALMGAMAVGPAPASAARGMEVALQDDLLFLHRGASRGQYMSRDTAFEKMRGLQGSVLRVNLIWAQAVADSQMNATAKPAEVSYDWAPYDELVSLARGYGVRIQFSLTGPAPAWATESGTVARGYHRPNVEYFREFASAVAAHFRGRIKRYSIWNEPNWDTWLGPMSESPLIYRRLYQAGYRAVKAADPRAQVLIGELSPYKKANHSIAPLSFLRQMTCVNGKYRRQKGACQGGALKADGFAHHPYDFKYAPTRARPGADNVTIATLGRLTRALDKLKAARVLVPRTGKWLPLYLTEYGYFRAGPRAISEARRARWTREGFEIARKHPRVKQALYYLFVRPPGGTFFDLSLLDHTGFETRAYTALKRWASAAAEKKQIKRPGEKRSGVGDTPPPPPPPDGGGGGGGGEPPPEEPRCPIELPEGFPCPFLVQSLSEPAQL